jgi:hypothetical protein
MQEHYIPRERERERETAPNTVAPPGMQPPVWQDAGGEKKDVAK